MSMRPSLPSERLLGTGYVASSLMGARLERGRMSPLLGGHHIRQRGDWEVAVDYSKLTVAALRGLCSDRGIQTTSKTRKADLVRLLS